MWFYPSFRTLVTSLALISPGIASAQQYQDWTWCYEPDSTRDQTIAGCTALILSGRESKDHLAVEFYNRAYAHHAMGNYDYAIADYDQATRLNPKDAPT
jgi:tetratricopeptide (TPR) repeat protein